MKILSVLSALLALAMLGLFLGTYAVKLNSLPLWLIIGAIVLMAAYDFLRALREPEEGPE